MTGSEAPEGHRGPGVTALVLKMTVLVLVGGPMVYVIWDALNHLLAGDVGAVGWSVVLPVLVVFAGLLLWLASAVERWDRSSR